MPPTSNLKRSQAAGIAGRSLQGLIAALLPPEEGGPDPATVVGVLERFLSYQPPPIRLAGHLGALSINAASLLFNGRTLASASPDQREKVMARLTSTVVGSGVMDGIKALVLMAAGSESASTEILAAAAATETARPDAVIDVTPAGSWPSTTHTDVVVIGSGAGGAVAAMELAEAGLSVVIVEEGRRWTVDEFRTGHPVDRYASLYRDGGSTVALGLPPVVLPIGRAVGGTTVVNSGTCFRTPRSVLESWRDKAGLTMADPAFFNPFLDRVWSLLQVAPVPLDIMGNNGKLAIEGARKLGWAAAPLDRNAPGCDGCCQCAIGCPRNAKFGVHLNALPRASAAGARIVSEARVTKILLEGGRAAGVEAVRSDGSLIKIMAPRVVVAAGTTETPPLLRRSRLNWHPMVGKNLALHPAVGVAGRMEEPVVAWHGVLQSSSVSELHAEQGIMLEATSTPPGMGSMVLPGVGRRLVEELAGADHLATLGGMVADESSGRVVGANRTTILYNLSKRDGLRLLETIRAGGKVLMAAGATEVLTGIPGYSRVRSEVELDDAIAHARPRDLHVAAFHPVGTVAAGSDPERYPLDPSGALRGMSGVWVADGSVLPTCPAVNPQVSIMGLSLAIAGEILKKA